MKSFNVKLNNKKYMYNLAINNYKIIIIVNNGI